MGLKNAAHIKVVSNGDIRGEVCCPPETAVIWFIKLFHIGLRGIKLEETISMMMGIKQITWIINQEHFVPDTLRKKWLLLTQSTSHLFYGKLLKCILKIKLLMWGGKHENNECHGLCIRECGFQSENRDLLLTCGLMEEKHLFTYFTQKTVSSIQ